ncbi:putative receptor-like protein kinase At4g00960 [Carya illinoinensis]|uniref:putative receptor-like protein kinase At4g00960 n=1 Tax=Carya illinoinensis TaxID=32201 RepID=UPI001C72928E|nr:putative receptor-like protein kinase At4g00960 [Carya illinoinensis]
MDFPIFTSAQSYVYVEFAYPIKRTNLDCEKCWKIIIGISRGLLYLHEDSRLPILLKTSNLLDSEMNPKISDFSIAKTSIKLKTIRVESWGPMGIWLQSPEYVLHGQFSVKFDVFNFGVLVLEIAWKNWRDGTTSNVVDPTILNGGGTSEIMIRRIHIGLLCVQDNVANRPTMAAAVLMLNTS